VTASCGAIAETRTGTIGVFHNVPGVANPYLVTVNLICKTPKPQLEVTNITDANIMVGQSGFAYFDVGNNGDPGSRLNWSAQSNGILDRVDMPSDVNRKPYGSTLAGESPTRLFLRANCIAASTTYNLIVHITYRIDTDEEKIISVKIKCTRSPTPSMAWGTFGGTPYAFLLYNSVQNISDLQNWVYQSCGLANSNVIPIGNLQQLEMANAAVSFNYDSTSGIYTYTARSEMSYRLSSAGLDLRGFDNTVTNYPSASSAYAAVTAAAEAEWQRLVGLCAPTPITIPSE
jgi:hypothetical protein